MKKIVNIVEEFHVLLEADDKIQGKIRGDLMKKVIEAREGQAYEEALKRDKEKELEKIKEKQEIERWKEKKQKAEREAYLRRRYRGSTRPPYSPPKAKDKGTNEGDN